MDKHDIDMDLLCQGLGDRIEDKRYEAAARLHKIGLPALGKLLVSTGSPNPVARAMAINTIRDLYIEHPLLNPGEIIPADKLPEIIQRMLDLQVSDEDMFVRQAAILLLGKWEVARAIPDILKAAGDPSDIIRLGAAVALSGFDLSFWQNHPEHAGRDEVEQGLLRLSADVNADVREYALFGIRHIGCRTQACHAALLAALEDGSKYVRGEAAMAMAEFDDPAFVDRLASMMMSDPEPTHYYFNAAARLADRTLLPALQTCIGRWRQTELPETIAQFSEYAENAVAVLEGRIVPEESCT